MAQLESADRDHDAGGPGGRSDVDFDNQTARQIVISAISMYGVAFPVAALHAPDPAQVSGGETWSAMACGLFGDSARASAVSGYPLSQLWIAVFLPRDGVQPEI